MNIAKEFKSSKRNLRLDFIKGITIFLVVYGHVIQYSSGENYDFFENYIFKLIYIIHMPLFGFLSGFLFYNYKNEEFENLKDVKKVIKKKFKSLIVPVIIWTITIGILKLFVKFIIMNNLSLIEELISLSKSIPMNLWFLWGVFYCCVAVIIIEHFFKGNKKVYILSIILMMFIPDFLNFHLYKYIYLYFISGYLLKKYDIKKNLNIISKVILIISFLIGFFIWNTETYIYNSKMFLFEKNGVLNQLGINIFRFLISSIGCYLFILLMNKIFSKNNLCFLKNIFISLGKKSLGIYIISGYIMIFIEKINIPFINIYLHIVVTTIIIAIFFTWMSVKLNDIIQKNNVLNKFLLGGR